jgi:1-acyl-sn-glycerol-3-phosphate acyltransferase
MQTIIIDKPYVFVPPHRGTFWASILRLFLRWRLRRAYDLRSVECRGAEKLKASYDAGHGIILAPNHCRPYDPMVMNVMCTDAGVLPYFMASWHLFMQDRVMAWSLPRLGCISIYREGLDRQALNMAIEVIEQESRPLIVFAEGYVSRHNDLLNPLNEGVAFIARSAAKKRAAAAKPSQVVVHPVALRYLVEGDVRAIVEPVLTEIETRLTWRCHKHLRIEERIAKVGSALLALKEIEITGAAQTGTIPERLQKLIDAILIPIEKEWLKGRPETHTVARVIKLRMALLPDMVKGDITEAEKARRWRLLADLYLAQQLSCYPPDYLAASPTPERLLETVERYEEDLKDDVRPLPHRAIITMGDAIVVNPERQRGAPDAVMTGIETQLKSMLGISH